MTLHRSIAVLARATTTPLMVLAVLAMGGGVSHAGASTASSAAHKPQATVHVSKTNLGKTLVNAGGRTLYLFQKDSGSTSECTRACATAWPPLTTAATPAVGHGAKASLIGTTLRPDGQQQVTYKGHPLYLFQGDHKGGATNGEGLTAFGGSWFALSPGGNKISANVSNSSGASNSGGLGY
jgi:predicted lipoprotein with Yx(FWY)xxD motif